MKPTTALCACLLTTLPSYALADVIFSDGNHHIIDYNVNDRVLLRGETTSLTVTTGGVIEPPPDLGYSGLHYYASYAGRPVTLEGNAIVRGGATTTGTTAGSAIVGSGPTEIRDNAQVLGGDGPINGGTAIITDSGSLRLTLSDNALIRGGNGATRGGYGIDGTYSIVIATMQGGSILGGSGGRFGGGALFGPETSIMMTLSDGIIRGGEGSEYGGSGYLGGRITMTGGHVEGGRSEGYGGRAMHIDSNYDASTLAGGKIIGGYGGERGGDALSRGAGGAPLTIEGGLFRGGPSAGTGGSALLIHNPNINIFGGQFEAGTGDVEDGWLIYNRPSTWAEINIYGGLFGAENVGRGFGLWDEAVYNIYGRDLKLEDNFLTGWLQDGNYIKVPVYFDSSFVGEFNLHNTAVPLPAAAWLLGSGLLGLMGVARRRVG